jgi:hypothetical protein
MFFVFKKTSQFFNDKLNINKIIKTYKSMSTLHFRVNFNS